MKIISYTTVIREDHEVTLGKIYWWKVDLLSPTTTPPFPHSDPPLHTPAKTFNMLHWGELQSIRRGFFHPQAALVQRGARPQRITTELNSVFVALTLKAKLLWTSLGHGFSEESQEQIIQLSPISMQFTVLREKRYLYKELKYNVNCFIN